MFFINPRIEGLYDLEAMIRRLVPDARTVVAHGQMPPEKLEKSIADFVAHDYDILLATTIVESGIDIPNVNTIIINNAHNFGLSELHQLRGAWAVAHARHSAISPSRRDIRLLPTPEGACRL